ncbi:MAG TPA: LptF/LptG family permease [Candidatus Limnocylindrales bacterium]|nr:LptF/LptG family permease [Candidatus Limnocylindrales bacterium]
MGLERQAPGPLVSVLGRYLVGLYLRVFALCLTSGVGLLLVVQFFGRIGDFVQYESSPALVAAYFFLRIPEVLVEVFPAAALLAVMLSVGSMVRFNEVLALQSCGVNVLRLARPLLMASIILSVATLLWNETIVPPSAARARNVKDLGIKGLRDRGLLDATSLWFQLPEGFLKIEYFDATREILHGVTLHVLDESFRVSRLVEVSSAIWRGGRWELGEGTVRTFAPGGGFAYRPLQGGELELVGTPSDFRRKTPRPDEFNFLQLRQRIRMLEAKGLDPAEFQTDLQFKLALPMSGVITVLLGLPLALRSSRRGGGMAAQLITGVAVVFLYWLTQAISVSAGHAGALPPVIAAWTANVLFVLVGGLLALRT